MSMSNIVEEWNNARIRYQNRYYGACKNLRQGKQILIITEQCLR